MRKKTRIKRLKKGLSLLKKTKGDRRKLTGKYRSVAQKRANKKKSKK